MCQIEIREDGEREREKCERERNEEKLNAYKTAELFEVWV